MSKYQRQRYSLVLISNLFFIGVCYYSGLNGQLQDWLSSILLLWLLFISFILLVFYEPHNKDKRYKRFHDNILVIKKDNSNFQFISLRLVMTIINFQLTSNVNWLLIMGFSYSLIPLILFKQFFTKPK